jgi:tetratricopeptide (TPR) repeat protein
MHTHLRNSIVCGALCIAVPAVAQQPPESAALIKSAVALDLDGHYADARAQLTKAIGLADSDSLKTRARRTLAVSYAFTCDRTDAAAVEHQIIDPRLSGRDFTGAADVDNELARILLECGDLKGALDTYRAGHDAALQAPALSDSARDLWNFRWEHAQARIAARRGARDDAMQHVAAAKAILDKGTNPDQARFFPYLTGYVALYTSDYKTAISDLQRADQRDPFVLCLLAQAYERSGDKAQAGVYYRKVLEFDNHNPPNAFARPVAKKKVAAS